MVMMLFLKFLGMLRACASNVISLSGFGFYKFRLNSNPNVRQASLIGYVFNNIFTDVKKLLKINEIDIKVTCICAYTSLIKTYILKIKR